MNLNKLHPGGIGLHPEMGIQELMRIFLMRTNFVPGTRHVIGWCGLKDSSKNVLGWTAKIRDSSGIYGIYFDHYAWYDNWIRGQFVLCYFPDPEEALVELFSVGAIQYTQWKEYIAYVRDFLSHPEFCSLFSIADVDLCASRSEDAIMIGLGSVSTQSSISRDGITIVLNGHETDIVEPGSYDQNFPAYDTALRFFRVLAASVTFNLEEPPVYLCYESRQGEELVYTSNGKCWKKGSDSLRRENLYLGYGAGKYENILTHMAEAEAPLVDKICWEQGDAVISEYKDELWWTAHELSGYKTLDKKILGIDERPQLIIVTGFLGSGKTTFVRNFIEYHVQHNRFVAVIQNEIGKTSLDGKLLDHDYSVVEIDEGCVCCTLIGSLKRGIHQIMSQFQPDYIIVETTGLANPFNLLEELSEVEDIVKFDSVTTVVDGVNMEHSLKTYTVAYHQIAAADILLINKRDLMTDEDLSVIKRTLREINETAPIISVAQGDINPVLLYGIDPQDSTEIRRKGNRLNIADHTNNSHEKDGLQSFTFADFGSLDRDQLIKVITSLPHTLFRIKGVLDFHDSVKPHLFQYVNGRFEFSELHNPAMTERFLTLIGQNIQKESLHEFLHILFSDR